MLSHQLAWLPHSAHALVGTASRSPLLPDLRFRRRRRHRGGTVWRVRGGVRTLRSGVRRVWGRSADAAALPPLHCARTRPAFRKWCTPSWCDRSGVHRRNRRFRYHARSHISAVVERLWLLRILVPLAAIAPSNAGARIRVRRPTARPDVNVGLSPEHRTHKAEAPLICKVVHTSGSGYTRQPRPARCPCTHHSRIYRCVCVPALAVAAHLRLTCIRERREGRKERAEGWGRLLLSFLAIG